MTACQNYLDARKISPETAAAHRLEIDAAPAAKRIIERLGDDIQIAGPTALHLSPTELLWIPYLNADGGAMFGALEFFRRPPVVQNLATKGAATAIHYAGDVGGCE